MNEEKAVTIVLDDWEFDAVVTDDGELLFTVYEKGKTGRNWDSRSIDVLVTKDLLFAEFNPEPEEEDGTRLKILDILDTMDEISLGSYVSNRPAKDSSKQV
jgi:hypothetical protein